MLKDHTIKMSNEAINDLKRCIKQYRDVDNELRVLNKHVAEKRESRKIVEMEMADLMKLPQFNGYDKLKIDDDGSTIKIQRPETYMKPWSISQKELESLLKFYFTTDHPLNAESLFHFIVTERKKNLVGKEFDFTRVIPEQ